MSVCSSFPIPFYRKGSPALAQLHPKIPANPGNCLHSTGAAAMPSGVGFWDQLPPLRYPGARAWAIKPSLASHLPSLPTGNMLLCLSPAWLMKVPAPGQPGEAALLVSKAVSFHPGGLTFLDDFVPPRRATYFLAGLGLGPSRGREAAELARDLTCPTGASAELARLLEDRLLTRQLLAQQGGVAVPATLAFTYKPPGLLRGGDSSPGLRLVELSGKEGQETLVREEVEAFLRSEALGDVLQVTVSCPPRGLYRCQQDGTQARLPSLAGKVSLPLSPATAPSLGQSPALLPQFTHRLLWWKRPTLQYLRWRPGGLFPLLAAGGCEAQWLALAGAAGIASAPTGRAGCSGEHSAGTAGEAGGGGECPGGGCVPTCPAALLR